MSTHMNTKWLVCATLVAALAIWSPLKASASETTEEKPKMEDKMMDACKEMKAAKEKLAADIKVQDAELNSLLATMNSEKKKDKKLNELAEIVTKMHEQRVANDARKAKMEEDMMKHMMEHMQMGKESMAKCSMMKDMMAKGEKPAGEKNADEKAEDPHKGHH